jgi:hypothetical protein
MSTSPLEAFIKKYQTAKSYNSKEIRLTVAEAEELSTAIALALSKIANNQDKIIELQERLLDKSLEVDISGGGFR